MPSFLANAEKEPVISSNQSEQVDSKREANPCVSTRCLQQEVLRQEVWLTKAERSEDNHSCIKMASFQEKARHLQGE